MRANVSRLGGALGLLFLLVGGALGYWQLVRADELNQMPTNPRVTEAERTLLRGAILDRNGKPLAQSEVGPDGAVVRRYQAPWVAPITGYHSQRYGDSALELTFDAELRGTDAVDPLDELRRNLFHERPRGADLVTTIDVRIQQAAAEALGEMPGAIVALDPRTGEVLALASAPDFDPGRIDADFDALRDEQPGPLFNRATQSSYVPGSTFKLVTATAALDRSLVDLDQPFHCTTAVNLGGQHVDCKNSIHIPRLTYKQAFAWSSNRTFALSGLLLSFPAPINKWLDDNPPCDYPWTGESVQSSAALLQEYAGRYGFETVIPFDIPVEPSHLKQPGSEWSVGLLAATAFGQGEIEATPLQMALVAAAAANDGRVPRPFLARSLHSPGGVQRDLNAQGGWLADVMTPASAATLRDFMVEGVERGYAAKAALPGVKVGGKTGTAEVGGDQTPHAWFIGFAPADDPRVAVAVVVEHGGSGADVATPIGGEVLRAALDAYEPSGG